MRLVMIEWHDSYGCSSSWEEFDLNGVTPKAVICKSVGWLAHDGDTYKVVVPHTARLEDDGRPSQGCGDMTIPVSAIISIRRLTALEQTDE